MKKTFLFILILIFTFKMNSQKTSSELIELKNELITQAIDVAKDYNVKLDFSDESIKNVETILSKIHKEYIRSKNDNGLNGIAYMFGFYIIEVIEKNHGKGKIERNHPDFGENVFPFYWNGSTLFPFAWCQKRIFDGEGDNVEIKYQILILEEKNK